MKPIKRVALSTGGGDAPGLNAVIRAATLAACNRGWQVVGVRDGFNGLLLPAEYPDGGLVELTPERVRGIIHLGGTILGSTNRGNPIAYPVQQPDGSWVEVDRTDELLGRFAQFPRARDGPAAFAHHRAAPAHFDRAGRVANAQHEFEGLRVDREAALGADLEAVAAPIDDRIGGIGHQHRAGRDLLARLAAPLGGLVAHRPEN